MAANQTSEAFSTQEKKYKFKVISSDNWTKNSTKKLFPVEINFTKWSWRFKSTLETNQQGCCKSIKWTNFWNSDVRID